MREERRVEVHAVDKDPRARVVQQRRLGSRQRLAAVGRPQRRVLPRDEDVLDRATPAQELRELDRRLDQRIVFGALVSQAERVAGRGVVQLAKRALDAACPGLDGAVHEALPAVVAEQDGRREQPFESDRVAVLPELEAVARENVRRATQTLAVAHHD